MNHIHLEACESTQDYLLELEKNDMQNYLISTDHQKGGRGRRENKWISSDKSLCLSFTLNPAEVLTLTSAELSVIVVEYFKHFYEIDLFVKWPNDILNSKDEKCGGILIQKVSSKLIVGIGLNFSPYKFEHFQIKAGTIFEKEIGLNNKEESLKFYDFVSKNRKNKIEIRSNWESYCSHLNKTVSITEDSNSISGEFLGLGEFGEACLRVHEENQFRIHKAFNGSLRF